MTMKRIRLMAAPAVFAAGLVVSLASYASERGVKMLDDGGRYEGELRNGEPHGQGVAT